MDRFLVYSYRFFILLFLVELTCSTGNIAASQNVVNNNQGKARASTFNHPGILHNNEDLNRIRQIVMTQRQPGKGSYEVMKMQATASASYQIKGAFDTIARDGTFAFTKSLFEKDFNAAYQNAIMWVITNNEAHAKKSIEIINAYSKKLKAISGSNDNALAASLGGFILVNAAEIMRYTYPAWKKEEVERSEQMFRNVFVNELNRFFERKAFSNGNWGAASLKAMMGMGVYLNDASIFNQSVDFFYTNGKDNGSIANYVDETGQCQESGRDQPHVMLGLGCLAEACEVGFKQDIDMYAALGNRLMAGYEYTAKYNLGYDVPYIQWKDITGKYSNWSEISTKGRGEFRAVFEIAYNAFAVRKKLPMPYTLQVLQKIRPEGVPFTSDNPGFGTLLFYSEQ
jgi:hypothetical protein